jgi:hypothetical protein
MVLPSLLVTSQGRGLIDLPLRASNEGWLIWSIWSVWSVWFLWSVWSLWFLWLICRSGQQDRPNRPDTRDRPVSALRSRRTRSRIPSALGIPTAPAVPRIPTAAAFGLKVADPAAELLALYAHQPALPKISVSRYPAPTVPEAMIVREDIAAQGSLRHR